MLKCAVCYRRCEHTTRSIPFRGFMIRQLKQSSMEDVDLQRLGSNFQTRPCSLGTAQKASPLPSEATTSPLCKYIYIFSINWHSACQSKERQRKDYVQLPVSDKH